MEHYVPPTTGIPPRTDEELETLIRDVSGGGGGRSPNDPRPVFEPLPPTTGPLVPIESPNGGRLTPAEIAQLSPQERVNYTQSLAVRSNGGLFGRIGGELSPGLADTFSPEAGRYSGGGSSFDQALLDAVGYRPGSPGGPARQIVDQGALQAQQSAIQQTLDASLAQIADQFQFLQKELERQRQAGIDEIERARSQALESLTSLRGDFATQSDRVDAQIIDSINRTTGGIRDGADAVLRDLQAQGVSTAGVQEAIQFGVSQAESQGQLQADLVNRIQEINDAFLGRNQQTTENISQGASTDLAGSFAQLLGQAQSRRSADEFSVQEQARQALLQLALSPPKRTVGGGGGRPAGGILDQEQTLLLSLAMRHGQDGETALADILEGRDLFAPREPEDPPTLEDDVAAFIRANPEVRAQLIGAEVARLGDPER